MSIFTSDLLGPEGKKNPGLSSRASSVCFYFPTELFLSGTNTVGHDFASCHLSRDFLEVEACHLSC